MSVSAQSGAFAFPTSLGSSVGSNGLGFTRRGASGSCPMLCAARVVSVFNFITSPISSESLATQQRPAASATRSAGRSVAVTAAPSSHDARAFAAAAAPVLIASEGHVGGPGPRTPTASAAAPAVYTPKVAPTRSLQSSMRRSSGSSICVGVLADAGCAVARRVAEPAALSPPPMEEPATGPSPTRSSATHTSRMSALSEGFVKDASARNARRNLGQGHGGMRKNAPCVCVKSHSASVSATSAGVAPNDSGTTGSGVGGSASLGSRGPLGNAREGREDPPPPPPPSPRRVAASRSRAAALCAALCAALRATLASAASFFLVSSSTFLNASMTGGLVSSEPGTSDPETRRLSSCVAMNAPSAMTSRSS
mmetsp:Transcript_15537/g.65534  ORF Transcript_15537/g.65534 Transcript_15537/m.65534 type:complete len:367 (-) Transcript_15537:876-1976(-)